MKHLLHILTTLLLVFKVGAAPHACQRGERDVAVVGDVIGEPVEVPVPGAPKDPKQPPPSQLPPDHGHGHPHNHHHSHQHDHDHDDDKPKPKREFGISYSPYKADGTCKSQEEVTKDMAVISPEYAFVRIYGVDCNQTATVTTAAKAHDMQVFTGVFDLKDFPNSLNPIIEAAHSISPGKEGWSSFHTISIGNELIIKHQNTPSEVTAAVHQARSILRAAGYTGPVVTVDTYTTLLENPSLCEASDYCASNCHVFFDATQTPAQAGTYARDVAKKISKAAGGKRSVIAESGWPHAGGANGKAVPGEENQRVAVEGLRREFSKASRGDGEGDTGLVLFTAFDDLWKVDGEGTFGAEKFWGLHHS